MYIFSVAPNQLSIRKAEVACLPCDFRTYSIYVILEHILLYTSALFCSLYMKRGEFQQTNLTYSTRSLFILTQNRGSVPLAPNSGCPVFVTEEQRKAEMEKNMNKKYSPPPTKHTIMFIQCHYY